MPRPRGLDLARLFRSPRWVDRLILAEILAKRGQGPLTPPSHSPRPLRPRLGAPRLAQRRPEESR